MNERIGWGVRAKDVITGCDGVVVGYCEHITGCDTVGLQRLSKDGVPETNWFDETRIEVTDKLQALTRQVIPTGFVTRARPGGPQSAPAASRSNP